MVEAREGKDLAKLASRHLEEKYGCSSQDIILSQQKIVKKRFASLPCGRTSAKGRAPLKTI